MSVSPSASISRAPAVTPDTFVWLLYGYYPVLQACESVGDQLVGMGLAATYSCRYGGPAPFKNFWGLYIFTSVT